MKRFIYLVIVCFSTVSAAFAGEKDSLWIKANDAYSLGEYNRALSLYQDIEKTGYVSSKLLYNMANTYYKLREDGRAILYYEKALKLNPSNQDIKNNLEITRLKTLDRIETVPEFILATWVKDLRNTMSSNKWAWLGVVLFVITALLMLLFRYAPRRGYRKLSFILACVTLFAVIVSFIFSANLRSRANDTGTAIVLVPVSNVKSAPNATGNNLFILHEGTKVEILEEVGQWCKIELSDGRQGWMLASDFEII